MANIPTTIVSAPDYLMGVEAGQPVLVPMNAGLSGGGSTGNLGPAGGAVDPVTGVAQASVSGARIGRRVVVVGHSLMADAWTTTGAWTNWGWVAFARRYLGRSCEFGAGSIFAVGGKTLPEILSEQMAPAATYPAEWALVDPWQNSIGAMTATELIASGKTLIDTLAASGKNVVLFCARPTRGVYARSAADKKKVATLNRWIVDYAAACRWLMAYDPSDLYIDFSSGDAKSTYLRDDLHDAQHSARVMGQAVATYLQSRFVPYPDAATNIGDVYDATLNVEGNLLPNGGLFTGTTGQLLNGATGTVPAGWRGARTTSSATHSATFSITTDPALPTLPVVNITLGGIADTHGAFLNCEQDLTAWVAAGEVIQAEIPVEIAATSAQFRGVALSLTCADASYVILGSRWDGYVPTTQGVLGAVTTEFLLRTDVLPVPAGTKYIAISLYAYGDTTGTPAAVIKAKRAALRKVV